MEGVGIGLRKGVGIRSIQQKNRFEILRKMLFAWVYVLEKSAPVERGREVVKIWEDVKKGM